MKMVDSFQPRYITFDCYGTLINFQIDRAMKEVFDGRLPPPIRENFFASAAAYRFDEVLGPYKPYRDVVANATRRTAARYRVEYRAADGARLYEAIPTWEPHPEVPQALQALAERSRLVILSNSDEELIMHSVER